jgi:MFS family permease
VALFLLGLGWNFLFTGSTTLALTAYRPEEKDKAQGALNFCIFAVLAVSSLASGVLVTTQGWALLNLGSLLPLALTGGGAGLAGRCRKRGRAPVPPAQCLEKREAGQPGLERVEHRLRIDSLKISW